MFLALVERIPLTRACDSQRNREALYSSFVPLQYHDPDDEPIDGYLSDGYEWETPEETRGHVDFGHSNSLVYDEADEEATFSDREGRYAPQLSAYDKVHFEVNSIFSAAAG